MKRKISTIACAFAVLIWICAPVRAGYAGSLKKSQPWTLEVSATGGNRAPIAVSVVYVYSNGTQDAVDSFFVPAPIGNGSSSVEAFHSKIPRGTRQVIIRVDPPNLGGALVLADQGSQSAVDETIAQATQFVLEVVDLP
jgi:hypothetical protein